MTEYRPDPPGYSLTYTGDGNQMKVTRIADGSTLGVFDTRDAAVDAALANRSTPPVIEPDQQ